MRYDLFACMDYYWWSGLGKVSYIIGILWLVFLIVQKYVGRFSNIIWTRLNKNKIINRKLRVEIRKISGILLLVVIFRNLWGLKGGRFRLTTQMLYVIHIRIILWLSLQIRRVNWKFMQYMGKMVIRKTPLGLGIILRVIELIGKIVRPFRLCLRLSINMTTGHILLGLLAGGVIGGRVVSIVLIFILGFYLLFECLICLIQGFVFRLLIGEYFREHTV